MCLNKDTASGAAEGMAIENARNDMGREAERSIPTFTNWITNVQAKSSILSLCYYNMWPAAR